MITIPTHELAPEIDRCPCCGMLVCDRHPATVSFPLDPSLPPDADPRALDITRLGVTAFRAYLNCPFRFYLRHILGMEPLDDLAGELEAAEFGTLVHAALRRMAEDPKMKRSTDEKDRIVGDCSCIACDFQFETDAITICCIADCKAECIIGNR